MIQNALKKAFSPEFLNRIDDVVIFNTLTREDIHKIIDIELKGLYARILTMGYHIRMSELPRIILQKKDMISSLVPVRSNERFRNISKIRWLR